VLEILWERLAGPEGGMSHYWSDGPQVPGLLCDALAMGQGLLDAFALLGDDGFLERARRVTGFVSDQHRAKDGGFYDIGNSGPGKLAVRLTLMTENADAAVFFTRLADISGDSSYRETAGRALARIPNSHREHGAFAASFGHALARWLSPPLLVDVTGRPGAPDTLELLRAARSRLRHPNAVFRLHERPEGFRAPATATVTEAGRVSGPFSRPGDLSPGVRAARP
jgi:uncharacterized protein YyaL (SSP411 family)